MEHSLVLRAIESAREYLLREHTAAMAAEDVVKPIQATLELFSWAGEFHTRSTDLLLSLYWLEPDLEACDQQYADLLKEWLELALPLLDRAEALEVFRYQGNEELERQFRRAIAEARGLVQAASAELSEQKQSAIAKSVRDAQKVDL